MANRRLSSEELSLANELLDSIRERLDELSHGEAELLFAYRRKVYKELSYDERGKPMHRRRLKEQKRREQEGNCAICRKPLPETYCVLDRTVAAEGYTIANTRLIHPDCDFAAQAAKRYR